MVAFFDDHDVAGDDIGGGDAPSLTVPNDRRISSRHRAKGGHSGLGPRLLDVARRGIEQDDCEDRDRFIRQRGVTLIGPQTGRDRRRGEKQHDEHILELCEKPAPRRKRLLRHELVASVLLKSRLNLAVAETAPRVAPERGNDIIDGLTVCAARIRRFARDGRHVVGSLKGCTPYP
jgi:hypothetical protein